MRPLRDLPLTLRTGRLVLRPLRRDDVEMLWPHVSDPELPRWMSWEAHRDRRQTAEFLERVDAQRDRGDGVAWAILEGGAFRGVVALEGLCERRGAWLARHGDLGYWLARDGRGRGVATEAAAEALRFAFEDAGLRKVLLVALAGNRASLRVARRLGFRLVGTHRRHVERDGVRHDLRSYELLAEDWAAVIGHRRAAPPGRTAARPGPATTPAPGTRGRPTRPAAPRPAPR